MPSPHTWIAQCKKMIEDRALIIVAEGEAYYP
jgi:hypothetical protein